MKNSYKYYENFFHHGSHALIMCIRRCQDTSNKKEILSIKKD